MNIFDVIWDAPDLFLSYDKDTQETIIRHWDENGDVHVSWYGRIDEALYCVHIARHLNAMPIYVLGYYKPVTYQVGLTDKTVTYSNQLGQVVTLTRSS